MVTTFALAQSLQEAGLLLAAAAVAMVYLVRSPAGRAAAMTLALVVTPLLLVSEILGSDQLESVQGEARLLIAAALVAVATVLALSLLFRRKPELLPLLALAVVPFRIPIEVGDTSANLLAPLYLVVGSGCVNYIVRQWRLRGSEAQSAPGKLDLALAIFVGVYALQSLYSADFTKALDQLVFFLIPFALLFKLLVDVRWTEKLVAWCGVVVVVSALVFSGIGFWEYQTRHLFWNSSVIDANQFAAYFRVNSVFFDPNIFGRYLVIAMLTVVSLMLWGVKQRWYLGFAAVSAILWGGLLITFSQSSFGALLVGLGVLAALRWSVRWTAITAATVMVVGSLFVILFPDALHLRINRFKSLDVATSGRLDLVGGGLDLFAAKPLFGHGSGSFGTVFRQQRKTSSQTAATASHNIPVTVAAEQGVIGLVVYLALIVCALLALFLPARGPPGPNATAFVAGRAAIAAAFAAVVFHTLIYAAFLEDPMVWILLAVGLALYRQGKFAEAEAHPNASNEESKALAEGSA